MGLSRLSLLVGIPSSSIPTIPISTTTAAQLSGVYFEIFRGGVSDEALVVTIGCRRVEGRVNSSSRNSIWVWSGMGWGGSYTVGNTGAWVL